MSNTILVVDDDEDIRELLSYNLKQEGYDVSFAKNGVEAIKKCKEKHPDMMIIDIMMPEMDGIETCRQLKSNTELSDIIIVFLTARSEEYSEVAAFESGANDFIAKPIRPRALLSRIKAVLQRESKISKKKSSHKGKFIYSNLEFNKDNYTVKKDGDIVDLSKKEFELLLYLAENPSQFHNRDTLLVNIWEKGVRVESRTIDVHIRKIREKLGKNFIKTKTGLGYKFNSL